MVEEKPKKSEDLIIEAKNFFNFYKKEIGKSVRAGKNILFVNFDDIASFSHTLAEYLISSPEEIFQILEVALEESGLVSQPRVRLSNLPETQFIKIRNIRAKHLNQLISIEGIIRQASDVRPQVVNAKFECPACGTIISVLQIDKKFREPSRCSCGRKGQFRLVSKEMVDAQRIVIEESPESLIGGEQPRRISIFLKEDLVEPKMEEKTTPGARVKIIGVLKEVPVPLQTGAISTRFDLAIEANTIIPLEETFEEFEISEEDERQIQELAADKNILQKMTDSIAPSIYGYDEIKQSLVLQLFGGMKKKRADGTDARGDIHILLVGDPGVAKSIILKFMSMLAPKGRYVVGRGTSAAGLTATVVRDEFLRGWALEAGAMVLSNKGLVCIHPNSHVIHNNKIVPINSLFNENKSKKYISNKEKIEVSEISSEVPSLLGDNLQFGLKNISMIRRKKYSGKILKICLDSGFSLTLTPDHKLIDGNTLSWKEAKDFKKGDFLLSPLKLPENSSELYFLDILPNEWIVSLNKSEKQELKNLILSKYKTLSEFNKKYKLSSNYLSGGKQLKIAEFRKILIEFKIYDLWKKRNLKYGRIKAGEKLKISKITPSLAYFIGFIYGDGNIKINKKHSLIQITQSTKNEEQIKKLGEIFNEISYRKLGEYKRISDSIIRKKIVNSEHLVLYSGSNLLTFLYDFFTKSSLSNILSLPNECLKAFIAGCLDSDGCISIKNCTKKNKNYKIAHIEFLLSNDERANKNFMLALRRLDCYSKLIIQKPINIIRITGREDVITLIKEISLFSVKIKEIPLRKKIISSISSKLPIEPISKICEEIIRTCPKTEELNKLGLSSMIYNYRNKKLQPSREQLLKIKEKLNMPPYLQKEIDIFLKRDFFIDEIIDIKEEDYSGYVYDLFVPETHNFVCEGTIVHNCIDEIEKMNPEDRSAMHESMEQQSVTVSKANVQASLRSETSVLAAANPKLGRFEPFQVIAQQIDMPPTLLNRFDVIFTMRDLPDRGRDEAIATHVLLEHKREGKRQAIDKELFRKYVAYAKQKISPVLTDAAVDEIKKFYVELRNAPVSAEGIIKPIPISARQLEAMIRLSEAAAKARLSKKVTKEDAKLAIDIIKYYLMQVGFDQETKTFDIDRIATGVSTSQRGRIILVREALSRLENRMGKLIPVEEIQKELEEKMDKEGIEDSIQKLKQTGDIFEPRKGYVQRV